MEGTGGSLRIYQRTTKAGEKNAIASRKRLTESRLTDSEV